MAKKDSLTYKQALAELEELVVRIENPDTDLENIADEVKKALNLVKFCRDQIKGFREETDKLLT
ncbi:MAG: exodeoxyribonuclease VII small subunit [Bacteroidetes bacterium HGW-Bacteroidetes-8]|jgi:exodeoxyribonuclease VII small subunit|nr:MAG: exodeoxyribonuclease VII small subunit [Bacteroidetes bacterium HGW-Bacteroidetes-8]